MSVRSRDLGLADYREVWARMQSYTDQRDSDSLDELWFLQHPSVYTLGLRADRSHVLDPGDIPVVATDRGGQVTYHGPGQLIVYVLLDLRRLELGVRALVQGLEEAVIDTVRAYGVAACARRDAPGVYVGDRKLAALGIRIRRHCSYHGIAINVNMDLAPFERIHPCGYTDLRVTQLSAISAVSEVAWLRRDLEPNLVRRLGLARSPRG